MRNFLSNRVFLLVFFCFSTAMISCSECDDTVEEDNSEEEAYVLEEESTLEKN